MVHRCSPVVHCVALCGPSPASAATDGHSPGDTLHLTRSHPIALPLASSLASPLSNAGGGFSAPRNFARIPSTVDSLLLCCDASSPSIIPLAAATGLPTVCIRIITALVASCCMVMEQRLTQSSTFQLLRWSCLCRQTGQSSSGGRHCINITWMCSCLLHIIGLTALRLCCAALLPMYGYRSPTPTHALPHHRTTATQRTAQLTTSHGGASLAALTMHTLHAGYLISSGLQP